MRIFLTVFNNVSTIRHLCGAGAKNSIDFKRRNFIANCNVFHHEFLYNYAEHIMNILSHIR